MTHERPGVARAPAGRSGGYADRRDGGARLPYMPGLDGLRALAVIAVLLYHAGLPWIPGGFIGVEVFFVLSGFLITSLLIGEWRQKGSVDLKAFWYRRARRLLPALYVLIVATLAYCVVFLPGEVAGLRADALAALGYVTNWYLIFANESYFEAVGRPSLMKHLWSLAVEEQFYLLWPLVVWVGLSFGAMRWRKRRVVALALCGAFVSIGLMAVLYVPGEDPSRVYFGTDTRAGGLLLGAALALVWTQKSEPTPRRGGLALESATWRRLRRRWGWTAPMWLDALGVMGLATLVLFSLRLGEYDPSLYRGGLALVSVATLALIMALSHPFTRLGSRVALGSLPLRWIGERSYGIYLWHWPVYMVSRPQLDVSIEGIPLLGVRLGATVVLAELSYRYVEMPIRRGALERRWRKLREARGFKKWELGVRSGAALAPVVALSVALGVAVAHAEPPRTPDYLSTEKIRIEASGGAPEGVAPPGHGSAATGGLEREAAAGTPAEERREAAGSGSSGRPPTVTAIGDSAMLGAVDVLQRKIPNLTLVDARGSRQAPEAVDVMGQLRASGELGDVVIVHIGNNGYFAAEQFDEMMRSVEGARKVLVVNVTVPEGRSWVPNNQVLADGARRYPDRAVLVDWYAASAGHPEYFWDGIHLTPRGARAYADTIAAAYEEHAR